MQDVILHPVCINRLVVNLPAPSSHVFSYASRGHSTTPRPPLPRHPVHRPRPFIPLHMSPPGREALASVKGKERGAIAGRMARIMAARRRRKDPRKPTRKPCGTLSDGLCGGFCRTEKRPIVCDKENEINPSGRKFAKIGVNGDDEKADGPDYGGYCGLFASFKALFVKRGSLRNRQRYAHRCHRNGRAGARTAVISTSRLTNTT